MARARNIKPSFFTNDDLVELPFEVRLLFIGLWTLADREGRVIDRPKKIKMEVFPSDNVNCEAGLSMLADKGFILRYEFGTHKVIEVTKFTKHQSPHSTERDSTLPSQEGFFTVNERNKSGGVTGNFRLLTQEQLENNVKQPLPNVIPSLDNALNPESRILNPEEKTMSGAAAPDAPKEEEVKVERRKVRRGSDADYECAEFLFKLQRKVTPECKAPNFDGWANDIRLMREQDKRSHRDICELFKWVKGDSFWSPNVRSPDKLREKWDQLTELRARSQPAPAPALKKDWE